ncbi:GDP-mannose transporter into the lumen of the Golgi [Sporothrix stenoceras]|uniref:GDP-mannose transporter n=1 Tax=Sporothrix stenoceras TaxID=5173 RepID=A0ABR3YPJ8_9PEZI
MTNVSDKKNEDYVVRMSENEKDDYPGRPNPLRSFRSGSPTTSHAAKRIDLARIENSPVISVVAYCIASISMTVVNKYLVSGSDWNMNFLYLAIQSMVCVACIRGCWLVGVLPLDPFSWKIAKKFIPIAALLVGMIYTGAQALQFLSVPVYTIFKNLTIIVIAYGEMLWFGQTITPLTVLSFGLMVFSSVIAAWSDVRAALSGAHPAVANEAVSTLNLGYAWMGANVFCSATFLLGMRKMIKNLGTKDKDTMLYNNMMSVPILLVLSFIAEDWSSENLARNFPEETRTSQMIGICYSGFMAVAISYCSAWCVRVTSSTTYSMVGALNKLPIAISGLIFFDAPVTVGGVSAIAIGFVSGLLYAWAKVRQKAQEALSLPTTNQPVMSASAKSNKDAANA